MPRYIVRNLTASNFFVPQPVGEALGPHQTKIVTVAAAEMDVPAIASAISRRLISIESQDNPVVSNQIEVPTLSISGGGGGGGVTSVTASAPLASSGGATPVISLGTVGVAKGGTGQTSLTANAVVLGNGALAVQTVAPGASGNVLTSDGTTWSSSPSSSTPPGGGVGDIQINDGAGNFTGSTDLSFSAQTLEVNNTVSVTNGGNALTVQPAFIGSDAATLTLDAASTVQVGGVAGVSVGGVYSLPSIAGVNGQVLTTNGAGLASWAASAGGPPTGAAGGDLTGSTYPNPVISSFGGKIHWVVIGGKYATLQAAVNAAAADDAIMVGPPALGGTWADSATGGTVFPAGKRLAVVGMTGRVAPLIDIGKVFFTVSSGLNINQNELYLRGLFINGSFVGSQGVLFSGTNPARLRLQECYIFNSGVSGDCVVVENSGSSSSLYLDNCVVQTAASNTTSVMVRHTAGYTLIKNGTEISGGGLNALTVAAGAVEVFNALFEVPALSTGTVTAVTNNTISDATKNYAVNSLVGQTVYISAGTGAGQSRIITANNATQITVGVNWSPNPGALASTFSVGTPRDVVRITGSIGTTVSMTYATIRAPIGDSTGVAMTSTALLGMNNSTFSIASGGATAGTGTGYVISGVAGSTFVAGQMAYSNSAAVPYNVKFKAGMTVLSVAQSSTALANAGLTSAA